MLFLCQFLIIQRIWAFLILQGSNPDLSLKNKLIWTKRTASKGQLGFVILLLFHISIQAILFLLTLPPHADYYPPSGAFTLDPLLFLIITGFEVGFFLLLIIYQLIQFSKQDHLFLDDALVKGGKKPEEITQLKPKATSITKNLLPSEKSMKLIEKDDSL